MESSAVISSNSSSVTSKLPDQNLLRVHAAQSPGSNHTYHVHISAGQDVSVASSTDDTSVTTDSGTVYAAAAVAGVAIQNLIQIREVSR